MKVDEVVNQVFNRIQKAKSTEEVERLIVYMDRDFFYQCQGEIFGECSITLFDFVEKATILNIPIYQVISHSAQLHHPKFLIVENK